MAEVKTLQVEPGSIRAEVKKGSINSELRTIDITASTEIPVRSFDWNVGKEFDEILVHDAKSVNLSRANGDSMPILDNHNRWSGANGKLGKVISAEVEGRTLSMTLKFSKRKSIDEIWQDIEDGIHNTFSIGYNVEEYQKEENRETGKLVYRATKWTPMEVSIANVPADPNAKTKARSDKAPETVYSVRVFSDIPAAIETPEIESAKPEPTESAQRNMTPEELKAADAARAAEIEKARQEAMAAERTRTAEIRSIFQKSKLEMTAERTAMEAKFIQDGESVDKVRAAVLDEIAKLDRGVTASGITVTRDAQEKTRTLLERNILVRSGSVAGKKLTASEKEGINHFGGSRIIETIRNAMQDIDGFNTRHLSDMEVAKMALGVGNVRYIGTTDFPELWGAAANKAFLAEFQEAGQDEWKKFCTNDADFSDFNVRTLVSFGGLSGMLELKEGEEYKMGTFGEGKETYQGVVFGRMYGWTYQSMINDQFDIFGKIPKYQARAVAAKRADMVYSILESNPSMADGVAIFHANHNNLAGTPGAPADATLAEMKKILKEQRNLENANGDQYTNYLNLQGKYLVMGTTHEHTVEKILNGTFYPTQQQDATLWKNKYELITNTRITGNKWFLIGDPNNHPTIGWGTLKGEPEIFTDTYSDFATDSMKIKFRSTFAAKAIDFRNMVKNAG